MGELIMTPESILVYSIKQSSPFGGFKLRPEQR